MSLNGLDACALNSLSLVLGAKILSSNPLIPSGIPSSINRSAKVFHLNRNPLLRWRKQEGVHVVKENKNNQKVREIPTNQVKLQKAAAVPGLR